LKNFFLDRNDRASSWRGVGEIGAALPSGLSSGLKEEKAAGDFEKSCFGGKGPWGRPSSHKRAKRHIKTLLQDTAHRAKKLGGSSTKKKGDTYGMTSKKTYGTAMR